MTNEEKIKAWCEYDSNNMDMYELIVAGEREKMTQEKFAEYFNSLKGGEVASAILTQLLRKGVTDDDLRGLRLQWIKDEREKMQGVDCWVSWDDNKDGFCDIWYKDKPRCSVSGYWDGSDNCSVSVSVGFVEKLGLKKGQCKKFRIVEELP